MRAAVFRVQALLTAGGGRLEGKSICKMQRAEKGMERTNTLNTIAWGKIDSHIDGKIEH